MISSVRIRMVKKRGGCKLADEGKEGLLPDSLLSRLSFTAFLFLSYCTLPRVLYICHRPRHPSGVRMLTQFFIICTLLPSFFSFGGCVCYTDYALCCLWTLFTSPTRLCSTSTTSPIYFPPLPHIAPIFAPH